MVQRSWEVSALLLRGCSSNPGMRSRWRRPSIHHHQRLKRMAAGRRHGPLPAGPGSPAQTAAQLGCAGHELHSKPAADQHAKKWRFIGPPRGFNYWVVTADLWRGPTTSGPGQPHAEARSSPQ